jgi:hypothetical protein
MLLVLLAIMLVLLVGLLMAVHGREAARRSASARLSASTRRDVQTTPVTGRVLADYLEAQHWLNRVPRNPVERIPQVARYLCGAELARFHEIARVYAPDERYFESLSCEHAVVIHRFMDAGSRCVLIDHQSARRMTVYDRQSGSIRQTQVLEDCVLVYQMAYDHGLRRWKIERFFQQFPDVISAGSAASDLRTPLSPMPGRFN